MRHAKAGNRLGRKSAHRKATIRDLAKATLLEQRICTTKPKAKEARKLVDGLITFGKAGTLAARRRAFAILCDHSLVKDLFERISPRFKSRMGGYTRIIPLAKRRGDNAQLAFLELTEKEEVIVSKPKAQSQAKPTQAPLPETPKAAPSKPEPAKPHPQREIPPPEKKPKWKPDFLSGIRKMFTKRPPSRGS